MGRIFDIHNHILWGVDDGSKNIDMSLRMLKQAEESGTTDVILTPHNKPNRRNIYRSEMLELMNMLKKACVREGIGINLYPGNEIYYRMDVGERLETGKAATMAGSHYVLLEYNPMDDWDYIKRGADDMLARGYRPIIAHVERYVNVMKDMERVYDLTEKGCYLQVNSGSIMGSFGWKVKSDARNLLKEGVVSFVASDAHEDTKRTMRMDKCIRYLCKKYGEDFVTTTFETNPMHIINDEYI